MPTAVSRELLRTRSLARQSVLVAQYQLVGEEAGTQEMVRQAIITEIAHPPYAHALVEANETS